jgi:ketosteroid isomerase-like protein
MFLGERIAYPGGMTDAEVLTANESFYAAFARRDMDTMRGLWASACPVVCIHPGWPPVRGRKEILASWKRIFEHDDSPPIRCEAPTAYVFRDAAMVICRERIGNTVLVATNIFVLEEQRWRLAHHHASTLARIPETPSLDPTLLPN